MIIENVNLLIGQAAESRTIFELQPILPLGNGWQLAIFLLACLAVLSFVVLLYRRDAVELPKARSVLLTTLRLLAFCGLVLFVLHPQIRTETRIVNDSRLALLIDTSLSMGLREPSNESAPPRIDAVVALLENEKWLEQLNRFHEVSVYRFDDTAQPELVASFPKKKSAALESDLDNALGRISRVETENLNLSKQVGWLAVGVMVVGLGIFLVYVRNLFSGSDASHRAWLQTASVLTLVFGVSLLGVCDLTTAKFGILTSMGWKSAPERLPLEIETEKTEKNDEQLADVDWKQVLTPNGTATRMGQAIQFLVNKERGGSLAGILVMTDGRSNSGLQPGRAIALASSEGVPIFPVGIGSTETPKNLMVSDIQVPPRVFPGDKFKVKGLIQAFGLQSQPVRVQLLSVDEKGTEAETAEDELVVDLMGDGETVAVEFDVERQEQGKRRYLVRVEAIEGDQEQRDNQRGAIVEIVERKTQVLLIGGGPMRDFRFLRNQLFRDKDVTLHVWLQNAKEGADQESDLLLFDFPSTQEAMFTYDCVIAFDPDWRRLSGEQANWLERWIAEKAGGMIVVSGAVFTPEWTRRPRGDETIDRIRRLYPVSFYNQGSAVLKLGRFGGERAFPLEFTREGRAAEFLWLGDTAADSLVNWGRFRGVFGYYAVNEAKPGADILSYFADPSTSIENKLPIYMASQFYGAGRVFFQASGESWRMRRIDVNYFEQYYTKLIRWVSQGRLLRDSSRGVLLTDRERCWMGDQVSVQAILRDAQDEPWVADQVSATLRMPDGSDRTIPLNRVKDPVRPGTFQGQFSAGLEGEYRISLPVPASPDLEVLTANVEASIPDLEKERPERNDVLLEEIAERTQGHYYVGANALTVDEDDPLSPSNLIQSQDQETYLPGTPDRYFERRLMQWLLGLITMLFCFEWVIRRLNKLA